jgi:hypothetical protein
LKELEHDPETLGVPEKLALLTTISRYDSRISDKFQLHKDLTNKIGKVDDDFNYYKNDEKILD